MSRSGTATSAVITSFPLAALNLDSPSSKSISNPIKIWDAPGAEKWQSSTETTYQSHTYTLPHHPRQHQQQQQQQGAIHNNNKEHDHKRKREGDQTFTARGTSNTCIAAQAAKDEEDPWATGYKSGVTSWDEGGTCAIDAEEAGGAGCSSSSADPWATGYASGSCAECDEGGICAV